MERKDIQVDTLNNWFLSHTEDDEFVMKKEADSVMNYYECQIKTLTDVNSTLESLVIDKNERIKELEDKVQMHDFFWEGCAKTWKERGLKNAIAVAEYVEKQDERINELNHDLENAENTYYSIKMKLENAEDRIRELEWQLSSKDKE